MLSLQGVLVQSLVRELKISHAMQWGQKKKKMKKMKKKKKVGVIEEEGRNKINLKGFMNVTQK